LQDAKVPFEVLEHTADVGFRAWGRDPGRLFVAAARAMFSIAAELGEVRPRETREIAVEGEDNESLLVNWLSELISLFDAGLFAPCSYEVLEISETRFVCRCQGEPRDPAHHPWKLIVKAVTYHQLQVVQRNGRWEATVFLDI
jgi:SHS2 domain-containing protein